MAGAIGVLNAGSSSIKFSLFQSSRGELELTVRGQIEALYTAPHFVAKRSDGAVAPENRGRGHEAGS